MTVDGSGSKWTNSGLLCVGSAGGATLAITNGGSVSNARGLIGVLSGSTVTVDGSGSKWTNGEDLFVGGSGHGTLNVTSGGSVSVVGTTYVGYDTGSTGAINCGAGSAWTSSSDLHVGFDGAGAVTQTGGTISVAGTLYLGYSSTGTGAYNLNGGVLAVNVLSGGSGAAALNFGGGTLRANSSLSIGLPMTLTGTGGAATVDMPHFRRCTFRNPLRQRRTYKTRLRHADPHRRQQL